MPGEKPLTWRFALATALFLTDHAFSLIMRQVSVLARGRLDEVELAMAFGRADLVRAGWAAGRRLPSRRPHSAIPRPDHLPLQLPWAERR